MVGQRLAFNNDDTDCLVRQRLPSAPTALCLNNQTATNNHTSTAYPGEQCWFNMEFETLRFNNSIFNISALIFLI